MLRHKINYLNKLTLQLTLRLKLIIPFSFILFVFSCTPKLEERINNFNSIANANSMQSEIITTNSFPVWSYQKLKQTNNKKSCSSNKDKINNCTVRIYLEGDGFAWRSSSSPSSDPTPITPTMMNLILEDDFPNIVYLARPCQFIHSNQCSIKYWTSHRFANEIVTAVNDSISQIKSKYDFKHVELIGFSGGGAIAMLVASMRNDVSNIRTVAGHLDTKLVAEYHNVDKLHGSINPSSLVNKTKYIPQVHFSGSKDEIIPPIIVQTVKSKYNVNNTSCFQDKIVNATHHSGWTKQWKNLLKIKPKCDNI